MLIKHYRLTYKWGRKKLLRNFPLKNWTAAGLDHLLAKIDRGEGIEERKEAAVQRKQEQMKTKILLLSLY